MALWQRVSSDQNLYDSLAYKSCMVQFIQSDGHPGTVNFLPKTVHGLSELCTMDNSDLEHRDAEGPGAFQCEQGGQYTLAWEEGRDIKRQYNHHYH